MTLTARTLPEYERIDRGGRSALVHPDYTTHITAALFDGAGTRDSGHVGRGAVQAIDTPHGTVLIRQCKRGGAIGGVLGDRYFLVNRPRQELDAHREAWRRGVQTVLPVAAIWKRSGAIVRGAVATLKVDADDLLALCADRERPSELDLAACGRAIRSMHAAGVIHADLQIKNVLVRDGEAWVIDFDKAQIVDEVGPIHARQNFLRLKRSFQKRGIPIAHFDAIRDAYEAAGGVSLGTEKFRV